MFRSGLCAPGAHAILYEVVRFLGQVPSSKFQAPNIPACARIPLQRTVIANSCACPDESLAVIERVRVCGQCGQPVLRAVLVSMLA